jgi:hypothetical protein
VTRQALFPLWRWWWGPAPLSAPQEIAHGETVTQADGTFNVPFTAHPDPNRSKKESPLFHYTIYATVSDINGETHEMKRVIPIGYQSLLISTDIQEQVNGAEQKSVKISTTHPNGAAQAAQGTITVWKLKDPGRVLQGRRWLVPDQFSMTSEQFKQTFPLGVYNNEDNVANWEREAQVLHVNFDTGASDSYRLTNIERWKPGKYIAEVKSHDTFGEAVEYSAVFTLFSPAQNVVPANEAIWFHVLNPVVQPGEEVKILIGSAYSHVEAFYEITSKSGAPQRKSIKLNNEQKTIEIPVTEKSAATLRYSFSLFNTIAPTAQGR